VDGADPDPGEELKKTHRSVSEAHAASVIESPVGRLHLAATAEGLTHILFVDQMDREPQIVPGTGAAQRIVRETESQLADYFAGRRRQFDVPLAPAGTDFQRAAWKALAEVPYGETISYAELARRMERPRAVRAVGAANGANPIPIILPCHRIIGADNSLTGYGGGLDRKRRLLSLEGVELQGGLVFDE
jgi:methylated-DNA-[protein]-cysteine S-methyltransferase